MNIRINKNFLKKNTGFIKDPWLPYSFSLNCVQKSVEIKLTQHFFRVFIRKLTSQIWVLLEFRTRRKSPPVWYKILK